MFFCFKLLPRISAATPLGERLACEPRKPFPPQDDFYHRNKVQHQKTTIPSQRVVQPSEGGGWGGESQQGQSATAGGALFENGRLWQKLSLQVSKTSKHQKRKAMINTGFIFAVFLGLMTVLRAPESRSYSVVGLFFIPSF